MIRLYFAYHLITIVLFNTLVYFFAPQHLEGLAFGSLVIFLDLTLTTWILHQIFYQKLFALAASVIVLKYAILVAIIFIAIRKLTISALGFCLGIGTIIPAAVALALTVMLTKKDWSS